MKIHVVMIAISAASIAVAAVAQPGKDEQRAKAAKPAPQAPVVLASASDIRRPSPAEADRPAQPARRPAPRVTTCSCGDQPPVQDEQQPDE